jgi:hypothetical protein
MSWCRAAEPSKVAGDEREVAVAGASPFCVASEEVAVGGRRKPEGGIREKGCIWTVGFISSGY